MLVKIKILLVHMTSIPKVIAENDTCICSLFQQNRGADTVNGDISGTDRQFWGALLALGTSSVSTQLIVIREMMSTFSGNELVIGLVLGEWLLLSGVGSALGASLAKRAKPGILLFWGHMAIAILPFLQIAAIRALPLLRIRGQMMDLPAALFYSTLILLPYCLVGGGMIPIAGALKKGKETASRVYLADTIGDIAGGLLFSLLLVYVLSHWDSLIVVGLFNLVAASIMMPRAVVFCFLAGIGLVTTRVMDDRTLSWRFPGQSVLLHKNTPFAQLTITKTGQQRNVLQDAIPLYSEDDLSVEARVHLAMSQVDVRANVLLIAGGVFGTIDEIAKHEPDRIDYVELDPAIVQLDSRIGKRLHHLPVHVHIGDGRLFVKQTQRQYDAVIVDLPDPENAQLNRFYSTGFFQEVRRILRPSGVLCFSLVGAENYLEEAGLALNRSVRAAVKEAFPHVVVFPGQIHYFVASNRSISTAIAPVLAARGIETRQLVDYDLPAIADPFRIDRLESVLEEKTVPPNEDLSPRAFGAFLEMWLKKTGSPTLLLFFLLITAVAFAGMACRRNRVHFTIMTSGFSGMALELTFLLLFQVIYGYVYLGMCLMVTLFMMGSALGVLLAKKRYGVPGKALMGTDLILVFLSCLGCVIALTGMGWRSATALFFMQFALIPGVIFATACTVGYQFSAATRAVAGTPSEVIGRLYLADLAGAACGTILTGLVFIPRIGIIGVLVSVAIIKTVSLGWHVVRQKQRGHGL